MNKEMLVEGIKQKLARDKVDIQEYQYGSQNGRQISSNIYQGVLVVSPIGYYINENMYRNKNILRNLYCSWYPCKKSYTDLWKQFPDIWNLYFRDKIAEVEARDEYFGEIQCICGQIMDENEEKILCMLCENDNYLKKAMDITWGWFFANGKYTKWEDVDEETLLKIAKTMIIEMDKYAKA